MIFYTSICSNYLPKAMALAESVKRHCKDAHFVLCLVEREVPEIARTFAHFDEVVLAKDAGWDNFNSFIFRHSIVEASTAVKPRFMIHLLERYPEHKKFVYLDPDVLVYSDFEELEDILETHSIVLAPHLLRPGNIDMEISSLAHGTYNLGFLAIGRDANSQAFLQWWADRLFLFCYDDKSRGIFTDQKWIDLVPSFFDAHILKHHGYDFATWSLLGSDLREVGGRYVVNGDALRFIHFSGLDSKTIDKAIEWWLTPGNRDTFIELYGAYKASLSRHGQEQLGRTPWSYGSYANGAPISKEARVAYRPQEMWARFPDPFSANNQEILEAGGVLQEHLNATSAARVSILRRVHRSAKEVGLTATILKAIKKVAS